MISLKESLQEMVDLSATQALTGDGTMEGRDALVRMTLLLSMLERLDAGGGSWGRCDVLPEMVPLRPAPEARLETGLPQ